MARKPKRYKKSDLISKIKSHLRKRYGVPEELIDYINFDEVIREGMTMSEAYKALVEAYPALEPYLEKRRNIKKIETEAEEDLYSHAKLLESTVEEAEKGDKMAISIVKDLLRKAIVQKDKDAIEIIKMAYNLTPGEFARQVLIPKKIISEKELKDLLEEAKKVSPPPKEVTKPEYIEYERLVKEIRKELKDIDEFLRKFTLEDLKRIGAGGFKAILDKYLSELKLKAEKLKQLKEKLPEKTKEIDSLLKKISTEEKKLNKVFEGLKPFDIEQVIKDAVAKLTEKIAETFREVFKEVLSIELKKEISELQKEIRRATGELTPEDYKYCCTCYYCNLEGKSPPNLAVKYYENLAVCIKHAKLLEKEWASQGLKPQWNPDDMGVCTNCGRMVKLFRCSAGVIYCLDCSMELEDELLFDDQLMQITERARVHVKRVLKKLEKR